MSPTEALEKSIERPEGSPRFSFQLDRGDGNRGLIGPGVGQIWYVLGMSVPFEPELPTRRLRANPSLRGRPTVKAQLHGEPVTFQAPIPLLLSPKLFIDLSYPPEMFRWKRALEKVGTYTEGPIRVTPGLKGIPVAEVQLRRSGWRE